MKIRRTAVASVVLVAMGLSACSSEASKLSQGAVTTVAPETTTASSAPSDSATPDSTTPGTTTPGTTTPGTTTPGTTAPPVTTPAVGGLYEQVPSPIAPAGHTHPFNSSDTLADGTYWATYNGGEAFTPAVTVWQAFFGSECETQAAAAGEECLNDIFVPGTPARDITYMTFAKDVFISVAEPSLPGTSFHITPDELIAINLVGPSAGAPAGYTYVKFPWMMTVSGGEIDGFEQFWVP